jgi:hypothetical protein
MDRLREHYKYKNRTTMYASILTVYNILGLSQSEAFVEWIERESLYMFAVY